MFEESERKLGWRGEARGQSGMPAMPTHHLTHPRSVRGSCDMGEQLHPLLPPRCFHFPSRCPGSAGFSHMAGGDALRRVRAPRRTDAGQGQPGHTLPTREDVATRGAGGGLGSPDVTTAPSPRCLPSKSGGRCRYRSGVAEQPGGARSTGAHRSKKKGCSGS